jgi:hypothetical protein
LELKIAHEGRLRDLTDEPLERAMHGLWVRDLVGGPWRLQVNLEPIVGSEWVYRREPRVRLPLERLIWWRETLPYVNPAVQLLWKAKDTRPKDEQDFETVVPLLREDDRRWLAAAIALSHPQSAWAARLASFDADRP